MTSWEKKQVITITRSQWVCPTGFFLTPKSSAHPHPISSFYSHSGLFSEGDHLAFVTVVYQVSVRRAHTPESPATRGETQAWGNLAAEEGQQLSSLISWLSPHIEAMALPHLAALQLVPENPSSWICTPISGSLFPTDIRYFGDVSISCDRPAAFLLSTFPLNFPASRAHLGVNKHFSTAQESPYLIPSTIPLHPEHAFNFFPSTCSILPPMIFR